MTRRRFANGFSNDAFIRSVPAASTQAFRRKTGDKQHRSATAQFKVGEAADHAAFHPH